MSNDNQPNYNLRRKRVRGGVSDSTERAAVLAGGGERSASGGDERADELAESTAAVSEEPKTTEEGLPSEGDKTVLDLSTDGHSEGSGTSPSPRASAGQPEGVLDSPGETQR